MLQHFSVHAGTIISETKLVPS